MIEVSEEKRVAVLAWLMVEKEARVPRSGKMLCEKLDLPLVEYEKILYEFQEAKKGSRVMVEGKGNGKKGSGNYTHDSRRYLLARTRRMDDALVQSCEKGNPQALKLFYDLTGQSGKVFKKKKRGIDREISDDDIYRARERAKKAKEEQNGEGSRDREVC